MTAPLDVARFDREYMSLDSLRVIVATHEGRLRAEALRASALGKRKVLDQYMRAQLAEIDELVQRLDLVLESGVRA